MASGENDDRKPRRDFLGMAIGGSAAAFGVAAAYPVVRFVSPLARQPSGRVVVGRIDELPPGSAKTVVVDDRPVLVVRAPDGQVRAFSAICTHLQCVIAYSSERNRIECPCHGGVYSVSGENVDGPPPRPLREVAVSIDDGTIVVGSA